MAKGPANQGISAQGGGGYSGGGYGVGGNPDYGATATMPSPALMPSANNPAQYDVGGGLKSTVKPVLGAGGIPMITPEMRAAAAAPIPGAGAGGGYNPSIEQQFLMGFGADPRVVLGKNYDAWASAPVTRGSLAAQMGTGGNGSFNGPRFTYGSKNSRYNAGGHG